ncbi:DUF1735 domain-containing protein [Flammeovirga agarivorans]|uniref:DUF1735 domain-containing protein n=1 Tax=Flammeovirga agarivorans TaxID=2726742 RepID=A0A7X8SPN6_9BACT|nr:DUF1735 domain-containing protein [Flammeovirga agarivorans]NLR94086.1 DUF1735 domain-containing protein [Flammeovirga agarivorans]
MKKYILIVLVLLTVTSCKYEEYINDYDYTTVYFSFQTPIRTLIVGEYEAIKLGIAMGGKRENKVDEWAHFEITPELLAGTPYKILPSEVYTLENDHEIIIPKGEMQGDITVSFNMEQLASLDEPVTEYALPVTITSTSLDRIHETKNSTIIAIKYIANLDGTWYHKGITKGLNLNSDSTWVRTYTHSTLEKNHTWVLNSLTSTKVESNGIGYLEGSLQIDLNDDHSLFVTATDEENFISKSASLSNDKKEIYLSYSFQRDTLVYESTDTLIFADRNIVFETW